MSIFFLKFFCVCLSYIVGSIPFGFILTKLFAKKNIQELGSGNIGATNVLRVVGKKLGYITFILDGLKGVFIVYLLQKYSGFDDLLFKNLIVAAAVIGHIYPVWLKFKGGKGVATFMILSLYTEPLMFFMMAFSWVAFYKMFYIVSLSSVIAMMSALAYQLPFHNEYFISSSILSLLIMYKHKANIIRIFAGQESSFKK
jgi:glycerol-3-phosphate acyltransferase PlsY